MLIMNLRIELMRRGKKVVDIVRLLESTRGEKICYQSFSLRLRKGLLRQHEVEEILKLIGCTIVIVDKSA